MEFSFRDERLNDRARFCFSKFLKRPALSFPQQFNEQKELQAFYRFINNGHVDLNDIKDAIFSNTKSFMKERSEAIAIHDTTHISPTSKLEDIDDFKKGKGFFVHLSLLVDSTSLKRIHGPGALHIWNRVKASKRKEKEITRWLNQVDQTEADFSNIDLIHVMDREGDACSIWSEMFKHGRRFVIRVKSTDRRVKLENDELSNLSEEMKHEKPIAERKVTLSKRTVFMPRSRYRSRDQEETILDISAKQLRVCLRTPNGNKMSKTVPLNVVRVFERQKGPKKELVEWLLLTTEPIETTKQVLRVVDIYRARWIIEEFFKGLKSGCRLEERLLGDAKSWHKLAAFCLPVATAILNIRLNYEESVNGNYFSPCQLEILKRRAKKHGRTVTTNEQAQRELAKLGGHITADGPPGWITLLRGYQELLAMEYGWLLSQGEKM